MIIVSSIPPNSENSVNAVKTWHKHGKVYSLNSEEEIHKIEGYDDVTFIYTHRVILWNKRPLVNINAIIDFAIEKEQDLLLINADIIIEHLPEFKTDGITILTRCDYEEKIEEGRLYGHGFDSVYIPKEFLKLYPPTIYCLGNCFWDYSVPYRYITKGVPVYWPQGKSIFHKTHPFVWNFEEWEYLGRFFRWEFKFEKTLSLEMMATNILQEIQKVTIK